MGGFEPGRQEIEIVPFEGGPCPVCGALDGTCKGESDVDGMVQFVPPKGDDPFATFRVPERVYEEYDRGNGRKGRRLLYAKGTRIRPEEAKRLGLM